jgi:hypothetical protein
MHWFTRGASALALTLATISGAHAEPKLLTLDGALIETARTRVASGDAMLKPAYDALLTLAAGEVKKPAETVTAKGLTPPSGDKHDYMSIAPYWWPDPSKPNGLPYIRKDGETNPSSKNDDTDSARIQRMCERVLNLALAGYLADRAAYRAKAAEQIRVWFLESATRMNPNLRYGQAVPGVVDGRGIGLIDSRNFWMIIDAVGLIAGPDGLKDDEVAALKRWFGDFATWMATSPEGHEEYTWHNNHGAYFDAQLAGYALFGGQTERARQTVADAIHLRLASHFAKDGKQYAELERTQPFHYSAFNLEAHLRLARYGEIVGVDYWNADQDGRTLKAAVDYLVPFLAAPKTWPYKDLKGVAYDAALPVVAQAARGWPKAADPYRAALAAMPSSLASDRTRLLWPTP